MTDKEVLIQMFTRMGATLKTYKEAWATIYTDMAENNNLLHFDGYNGFYTEFQFNKDGSLKRVGAYE